MSAGYTTRDPIEVMETVIDVLFDCGQDELSDEMEVVLHKYKELIKEST